jgi:hypothetical protein
LGRFDPHEVTDPVSCLPLTSKTADHGCDPRSVTCHVPAIGFLAWAKTDGPWQAISAAAVRMASLGTLFLGDLSLVVHPVAIREVFI